MRWLLALLALLGLSFFLFAQEPGADATAEVAKEPVTVIFVRHAETSGDTSGGGAADPKLSRHLGGGSEAPFSMNSHPEISPDNVCSIDRFSDRAVSNRLGDVFDV